MADLSFRNVLPVRRIPRWAAAEIENEHGTDHIPYGKICHAAADAIELLERELLAEREEAKARSLFDRTAAGHGFQNAATWEELAPETRQLYRLEAFKGRTVREFARSTTRGIAEEDRNCGNSESGTRLTNGAHPLDLTGGE